MEKVSGSLAVLAEKSKKRLKFGISPWRKFENANLLAEDFPLFPCLGWGPNGQLKIRKAIFLEANVRLTSNQAGNVSFSVVLRSMQRKLSIWALKDLGGPLFG